MPSLPPKARGELAEVRFLFAATSRSLVVAKPWGDNQPFDFVVGLRQFQRVQVKSASVPYGRGYHLSCFRPGHRQGYSADEIDILAAYLVPDDTWYVIPVDALAGRKTLLLYPRHLDSGVFLGYREAWHLLER